MDIYIAAKQSKKTKANFSAWAFLFVYRNELIYSKSKYKSRYIPHNSISVQALDYAFRDLPNYKKDTDVIRVHTDSASVINWLSQKHRCNLPVTKNICGKLRAVIRNNKYSVHYIKLEHRSDNYLEGIVERILQDEIDNHSKEK